ncbi:ankyrin [Tothia fuscella]|uniref:Ankyrin n=1 Tax=Tothia fuscella TaxID=1048955 RepID=A0A9P4TV54_9PEZI|nr:ankyrin [Tothia fuscella]
MTKISLSDRRVFHNYMALLSSAAYYSCLAKLFHHNEDWQDEMKFQDHLFLGAIIINSKVVLEDMLENGYLLWDLQPRRYSYACSSLLGDPFYVAAHHGRTEILGLLLLDAPRGCKQIAELQDYAISTSFMSAAFAGQLETVQFLYSWTWTFPQDGWHLHSQALCTPNVTIFNFIITTRRDKSLGISHLSDLLEKAVEGGWFWMARHLLMLGAKPRLSCLPTACRKGFTAIVHLLLEYKADTEGSVAQAVLSGQTKLVRILLDHGCDPNEGTPPPIVRAVQLEHMAIFKLLKERGAVLDTEHVSGQAIVLAHRNCLDSMLDLLEQNKLYWSAPPRPFKEYGPGELEHLFHCPALPMRPCVSCVGK